MPTFAQMVFAGCWLLPVALLLAAYDMRWIVLAVRAGRRPPWGTFMRLTAAVFCHGGAALLALHAHDWSSAQLTFWLHMLIDPGLTFYALGLWELTFHVKPRPRPGTNPP